MSLILPLLFLVAPSSLHTKRSSYFLIICLVCLANMCSLYGQIYLVTGPGEPNLSNHTCRFVVYISTFAKPIGVYLTLLFSIERLIQKILSKFLPNLHRHRLLFQRLFKLLIFLGVISIFAIRLFEILKLIPRNKSPAEPISDDDTPDPLDAITDTSSNSPDRNVTFNFCFQSMNIDTYARILSFYILQYWFEYTAFSIIILIFLLITIQQFRLPRASSSRFSINTKLYLALTLCFIISESILLFFHFIVDDYNNNVTFVQLASLQLLLFSFNFRCFFLPLLICLIMCDGLKEFLYELLILRSYVDNINENDETQSDSISSSHRANNRPRQSSKNNTNHNNEPLDDQQLQDDL